MPVPKSQEAMPNCDAVFIGNARWCKWQAAQDEGLRPKEMPRTIPTPFHIILEPGHKKGRPRDRCLPIHGLGCTTVFETHNQGIMR